MPIAVLLAGVGLMSLLGTVFSKQSSMVVATEGRLGYALFNLINGAVACLFFLVSSGFHINLNGQTVVYACLFATVVVASLVVQLLLLHVLPISSVNVIGSACSLIVTVGSGYLLFRETPAANDVFRVLLMLAAMLLAVRRYESAESTQPASRKTVLLLLAALVVVRSASTVLLKYYATDVRAADENSFFFFTNVILVIGATIWLWVEYGIAPHAVRRAVRRLTPKTAAYFAGNTVCSNVGSLIGIWLMERMPLSIYTPVSAALGIVAGTVASLLFRERIGASAWIAALLAAIAVIL